MNTEEQLAQLLKDVQYLKDRQAILDCVSNHARGCDRFDEALLSSTYHEDGADEHGFVINPGPQYAGWANKIHAAGSLMHTHNITTHTCEIKGDEAFAESYVMVALLNNDGTSARIISGRYVDHLQKRDGEWRIKLRRSTVDLLLSGDASILNAPIFKDQGYAKGIRGPKDVSYQRPLTLDETPERW
ncbi:nuclear transport factor 2 family protein [Pseudomaricurvus sp. HS19]|uniref:nuclear transport factor 2 family protein n=1 Tax=Pseudomaricurvus sp. HS19 TaxID=2692626 RepID=UPI0013695094|nr:nuclear transport factor 2 family protein [Pseudomaricurvus sp. HS19]MYM62824.1 nuclear transport factor 2 family protein [Pseudomaricurvus sp. HS19]